MTFKGYISRQHTVWCGVCGCWWQVDEHLKRDAVKRCRRQGWKQTRENGWVCHHCKNLNATEKKA